MVAIAVALSAPLVLDAHLRAQGPSAAPGGATRTWVQQRTAWGHPDLQGVWNNSTTTPLEQRTREEIEQGRRAEEPVRAATDGTGAVNLEIGRPLQLDQGRGRSPEADPELAHYAPLMRNAGGTFRTRYPVFFLGSSLNPTSAKSLRISTKHWFRFSAVGALFRREERMKSHAARPEGTETVAIGAVPHRAFVASGKTRTESDL